MAEGHWEGDRYIPGHYEPAEIPEAAIAAANARIVCDQHGTHPSVSGCSYDPVTAINDRRSLTIVLM
jgi:hypothetical protein